MQGLNSRVIYWRSPEMPIPFHHYNWALTVCLRGQARVTGYDGTDKAYLPTRKCESQALICELKKQSMHCDPTPKISRSASSQS